MTVGTVDPGFPVGTNIDGFDVGLIALGVNSAQSSTGFTVSLGAEQLVFGGVGLVYNGLGVPTAGTITGFRAGEKTTGDNELTRNVQNSFTFAGGALRGFGFFVDARTYLRNRGYYVQYSAPGGRPLNGLRQLYRLPNATVLNLNLHYTHPLGRRWTWRSQLNVFNALNHYRTWILPDPASGQFTRARLSVQPRTLLWSNTFSF